MRFISVKQADPLISDMLNIWDAYASFRWIVWTQRPPPLNYIISAFADHLFDNNHSPASSNPLPLHFIPNSRKLDMLELVEIKKALYYNPNILNNQLDIKKSPIIDKLINDI